MERGSYRLDYKKKSLPASYPHSKCSAQPQIQLQLEQYTTTRAGTKGVRRVQG